MKVNNSQTTNISRNVIPSMTNPLGVYWRQPKVQDIIIDNEYAVMTIISYIQLQVYNTSYPSGVYEGKMWRGYCYNKMKPLILWFSNTPNGDIEVNKREILIVD